MDQTPLPDHADTIEAQSVIRAKCEKFNVWCKSVGILCPKITYPDFFEGGLVGARVNAPIKHREAFLCVPYSAIISVDKCKRDASLEAFYNENPELFSPNSCRDWEQLVLTTFLMHQRQLGPESYWAPYIDLMPDVTFFCDNGIEVLEATADPYLVSEALSYKTDLDKQWQILEQVLLKYPQLFNENTRQRRNFMSFYSQVCTRCFGWGLPYTSMIPMADNLNHKDVSVTSEIVTKSLHIEADEQSQYFTKTKFMNDYSVLFTESEINNNPQNIKGRLNQLNYEHNQSYVSVASFKQSDKPLWEIPYLKDSYNEDNDTDEESDSSSDFNDLSPLQLLSRNGGLKYFIAQEKEMLLTKQDYKLVSEFQLDRNEYLGSEPQQQFKPIKASEESSTDTEEEFNWYKPLQLDQESYFCMVNIQRRCLQPGEQAYYCYGDRTNKFLLINYGFCFKNNRYDSYAVNMKMDIDLTDLFIPFMVDWTGDDFSQEVRIKNDQVSQLMLSYMRSICKVSYFSKHSKQGLTSILLTKPCSIQFEVYCLKHYLELVQYLLSVLCKKHSLQNDQALLQQDLPWAEKMAVLYRSEKKKILLNQIDLVTFVINAINSKNFESFLKHQTSQETVTFRQAELITDEKERGEAMDVWEKGYWYRRLINAEYLRDLNSLLN